MKPKRGSDEVRRAAGKLRRAIRSVLQRRRNRRGTGGIADESVRDIVREGGVARRRRGQGGRRTFG
jgi:hypothetical protein